MVIPDNVDGRHVIEAYRSAALRSSEGVRALAAAFKELFELSGEPPRREYFDQTLRVAIENCEKDPAFGYDANVSWVLERLRSAR